jgi:PknH-like extracellular domain
MTRLVPALALCVAVTFGALTTGCTSTVQGAAVKAKGSVPADNVPPIEESDLADLLLSNGDLNKIAGVEMESFYSAEEMNDNADLISDVDCVGAVYPGEDAVYGDTKWSAVRDELLLEADAPDDAHLVEQTVVRFDTRDQAVDFFDMSRDVWKECAKKEDITVNDGGWAPDEVQQVNERLISQKAEVSGTLNGICQHAMGVVSNVIVEGYSCDADDHDDAEQIASQILENAAD